MDSSIIVDESKNSKNNVNTTTYPLTARQQSGLRRLSQHQQKQMTVNDTPANKKTYLGLQSRGLIRVIKKEEDGILILESLELSDAKSS